MESDGSSHSSPGVDADLGSTDSVVVGSEPESVSVVSSVHGDLHPVDGALDVSSGSLPFGVPVSEGVKVSSLVGDGPVESLDGELVVVGSTHLGG